MLYVLYETLVARYVNIYRQGSRCELYMCVWGISLHTLQFPWSFLLFFYCYFIEIRIFRAQSIMDQNDGEREKDNINYIYMRIQSQATHLNTYTRYANVLHCDRTKATFSLFLSTPSYMKWTILGSMFLLIFVFFFYFFLLTISIHFAYIYSTVCKSTER